MNLDKDQFQERFPRVLVTGGAGFIGSCLIRKLLENTESNIYNLDKLSYSSDLTSINLTIKKFNIDSKRYKHFQIDLINSEDIKKVINSCNPDLVFHLAAESHVDRSIDNPKPFIENNIIGTLNLLENTNNYYQNLKESRKKSFRFINISTDEVFGSLNYDDSLFNEKSQYDPRSPYSASKASSDHLVNAWSHTYGLPTITTNCSNNFGPWQFPEKLIPLVILKALNLEEIPIYGKGENIRDWLFVEDHINALLLVASNAKIGSCYCIGGSQELTNNKIVLKICELLDNIKPWKKPYSELISYVNDRPGHDLRYAINAEKIKKDFGWLPKSNFNDALERTVKWYLNNLGWCEKIKLKSGYHGQRLGG